MYNQLSIKRTAWLVRRVQAYLAMSHTANNPKTSNLELTHCLTVYTDTEVKGWGSHKREEGLLWLCMCNEYKALQLVPGRLAAFLASLSSEIVHTLIKYL